MEQKHIDRFMSHVQKTDSCWIWTGCKDKDGYGLFRHNGKNLRAHRVAYEIFVGEIPDGMFGCHMCDNPQCCNPAHIFIGTCLDNHRDCSAKGRHAIGDKNWTRRTPWLVKRGEDINTCKLSERDVVQIRKEFSESGNQFGAKAALARKFGVTKSNINCILTGTTWKHLLTPQSSDNSQR